MAFKLIILYLWEKEEKGQGILTGLGSMPTCHVKQLFSELERRRLYSGTGMIELQDWDGLGFRRGRIGLEVGLSAFSLEHSMSKLVACSL